MFKCKIGVIAKIREKDVLLRLGDIIVPDEKNQINLYKLQSYTYFLDIKHVVIKDNTVSIYPEIELNEIRQKFNLTTSIFIHDEGKIDDGRYEILWTKLYDISCMQQVFDEDKSSIKPFLQKNISEKCTVILLPYNSSIKRGTLLESSRNVYETHDTTFICINDDEQTAESYKKYLMERGIVENNIDIVPSGETVMDDIMSTISVLLTLVDGLIYVAIDSDYICNMAMFIRKTIGEKKRLRYITNSSWKGFL